jgi:hypothetical protein
VKQSGGLWKVADAVNEVLNRIEQQKVEPALPDDIKALELLQMAYRGQVKLTPQQTRCAIEALAYENPKVSAVAVSHMTGNDFAAALDRAIARSQSPDVINRSALPAPITIEHSPDEMKKPFARLERFERRF